jgi:putative radical SAM enzyme (TIGR03279 family)
LTNLSSADWQRIEEQRLSPLYVSVHSTDVELRRQLLGNADAPDVLQQLKKLAAWNIELHTQLVVAPGLNDGEALSSSVADLSALWPAVQSISVVPVGLSRFHHKHLRPNTAAEAVELLAQVETWQQQYLDELGERLVYATDEWYLLAERPVPPLTAYPQLDALEENGVGLVSGFLDEWQQLRPRVRPLAHRQRLNLITAPLFARVLAPVAAEFGRLSGQDVTIRAISNRVLGETITVAGLLMGQDLVGQVKPLPADEWLLLPAVMFRGPGGVTLDGLSVQDVAAALGGRVQTVNTMGDIWNLLQGLA